MQLPPGKGRFALSSQPHDDKHTLCPNGVPILGMVFEKA
jgi:hypothetical protein